MNPQRKYNNAEWLPTGRKEMEQRGWAEADIIFFTGDAYVDHPSFGTAILSRILDSQGFRVGVVPQPNWQDDLRDFKKMGQPRLFFGVTAGSMDPMVNHYTATKRLRSNDAYTPGGKAGFRPDNATIVYTRILKKLFPSTPVIIGGIEASMRRFAHYDYWEDKVRPSILVESGADLLVYGMGEKPLLEITRLLERNVPINNLLNIPQTVFAVNSGKEELKEQETGTVRLHSFEKCRREKQSYAENFRTVEEESVNPEPKRIVQKSGNKTVVANPPFPPPEEKEMDSYYNLPYTRLPHPRYLKKGTIPAYEMIKNSITIHRGCFGGCSFCTISAHQGRFVSSRSESSVVNEAMEICQKSAFKGYISDIGGPTANMYKMGGKNPSLCRKCKKTSCLFPFVCSNLDTSHQSLIELYRKIRTLPGVKKAFVSSGIRYDLFLRGQGDPSHIEYASEIIKHHVSGRLKVAPEHTSPHVLRLMRKPGFGLFREMKKLFDKVNRQQGLNQQLIPYFISGHPGCSLDDMADLAAETNKLNIMPEQVQDFTPTPMTLSTVMYYTGINPFTGKEVFSARTRNEKKLQNSFFFLHKREKRESLKKELIKAGRKELAEKLNRK